MSAMPYNVASITAEHIQNGRCMYIIIVGRYFINGGDEYVFDDPKTSKAVIEVHEHIKAIEKIISGLDELNAYAVRMSSAHSMLRLPANDPAAYEAMEIVFNHFNGGKDNGKSK
mgnify:FL=1